MFDPLKFCWWVSWTVWSSNSHEWWTGQNMSGKQNLTICSPGEVSKHSYVIRPSGSVEDRKAVWSGSEGERIKDKVHADYVLSALHILDGGGPLHQTARSRTRWVARARDRAWSVLMQSIIIRRRPTRRTTTAAGTRVFFFLTCRGRRRRRTSQARSLISLSVLTQSTHVRPPCAGFYLYCSGNEAHGTVVGRREIKGLLACIGRRKRRLDRSSRQHHLLSLWTERIPTHGKREPGHVRERCVPLIRRCNELHGILHGSSTQRRLFGARPLRLVLIDYASWGSIIYAPALSITRIPPVGYGRLFALVRRASPSRSSSGIAGSQGRAACLPPSGGVCMHTYRDERAPRFLARSGGHVARPGLTWQDGKRQRGAACQPPDRAGPRQMIEARWAHERPLSTDHRAAVRPCLPRETHEWSSVGSRCWSIEQARERGVPVYHYQAFSFCRFPFSKHYLQVSSSQILLQQCKESVDYCRPSDPAVDGETVPIL
jgi:hypothetical protein